MLRIVGCTTIPSLRVLRALCLYWGWVIPREGITAVPEDLCSQSIRREGWREDWGHNWVIPMAKWVLLTLS